VDFFLKKNQRKLLNILSFSRNDRASTTDAVKYNIATGAGSNVSHRLIALLQRQLHAIHTQLFGPQMLTNSLPPPSNLF